MLTTISSAFISWSRPKRCMAIIPQYTPDSLKCSVATHSYAPLLLQIEFISFRTGWRGR